MITVKEAKKIWEKQQEEERQEAAGRKAALYKHIQEVLNRPPHAISAHGVEYRFTVVDRTPTEIRGACEEIARPAGWKIADLQTAPGDEAGDWECIAIFRPMRDGEE